jgi:prefoldin alpha subunit
VIGLSNEEKLQSLIAELRLLEAYLNEVNARQSLLVRILTESRAALEALNALPIDKEAEVLTPIGGGLFIHMRVQSVQRLVVSVGAGVTLEKSREEAKKMIEERIDELQKAISNLEEQKNGLVNRINAIKGTINQMIASQQQQGVS